VANETVQAISSEMKYVDITNNTNVTTGALGGHLTLRIAGLDVNITAGNYPGMPEAECISRHWKSSMRGVIKSLGIETDCAILCGLVKMTAKLSDVSELMEGYGRCWHSWCDELQRYV